jgi:hypothetical protein
MLCGAPGFLEPIRGNAEVPTSVWESTDNWSPFKNQHAMHALVELGYCTEFAKVAPRDWVRNHVGTIQEPVFGLTKRTVTLERHF